TYTITATNIGPSDAQGVSVFDTLPPQLTGATYCDTTGCTPSAPWTGSDSLGAIAAGGSRTITIQATVKADTPDGSSFEIKATVKSDTPEGAPLSNTASVSSATSDPGPAANSASATTAVIARADLAITKAHAPEPATAGNSITYTITTTNNGPSGAQNVQV